MLTKVTHVFLCYCLSRIRSCSWGPAVQKQRSKVILRRSLKVDFPL